MWSRRGRVASWRRTALLPHARDQLDLYTGFGSKRVWFTDAEVREHARSTETLRY